MKPASPFYVERQTDQEIQRQIRLQGATTIVKAPRQMGKSSLLARGHALVKKDTFPSFYLDFQTLDEAQFESLEKLLFYLATRMGREFKATTKPNAVWDEHLGAKDNLTYYLEEAILTPLETPVYLFLDEADRVFNYPYQNNFFGMIRRWHNLRPTNEVWEKLNLIIAHATDPTSWIKDINQSPFNVGTRIRLEDFDLNQIKDLNDRHNQPLNCQQELYGLMELVGGQPYLIRQALYSLVVNQWTMDCLQQEATKDRGPFGDHLRRIVFHLLEHKELQAALRQVLETGACENEDQYQRLLAAGLIKGESRTSVTMHCQLYADYCRQHL